MARALRAIQTTLVCCGTCDEKTRCFISTLEADGRPPTPSLKRANGASEPCRLPDQSALPRSQAPIG